MIRVNIVAEGKSELHCVKGPLNRYLGGKPILDSRCVLTSRAHGATREYRGGLVSYQKAKKDIVSWLKEDAQAYVTTMFDFFRLPVDFPEYEKAMQLGSHLDAVLALESAMKSDISSELPDLDVERRFIPYIQLHEFEALLFTNILVLKDDYINADDISSIDRLYAETKDIPPEEINHGADTAPSKRLLNAIGYQKGETVSSLIETITVGAIREKCPHFSAWLGQLQSLND
ncbi:MAG: DUF4276 family protein [Subdoligranulum sp.]|nr:DUF4276 family protein [Subdoligranulum sp.]